MKRIATWTLLACIALPVFTLQADNSDTDKQIIGAWQLKMTTPEGETREPVVLVGRQYDDYLAWRVGEDGLEALENVQLKNDVLVGTFKPKEHPDVTVTLEARLTGEGACEGAGKFKSTDGDSGAWKFTGKRLAPPSTYDVSKWKLDFETPDYEQHSATILVMAQGEDYHAWYSGKDHELPAREVKVDGDRITMKMSAKTADGAKVQLIFRGTVDGDVVKGNAEYKLDGDAGSFPFTAKRSS